MGSLSFRLRITCYEKGWKLDEKIRLVSWAAMLMASTSWSNLLFTQLTSFQHHRLHYNLELNSISSKILLTLSSWCWITYSLDPAAWPWPVSCGGSPSPSFFSRVSFRDLYPLKVAWILVAAFSSSGSFKSIGSSIFCLSSFSSFFCTFSEDVFVDMSVTNNVNDYCTREWKDNHNMIIEYKTGN